MTVERLPIAVATEALADALVRVWEECDKLPYRIERGPDDFVNAGQNLAESLSIALGAAAKRLAEDHAGEPVPALPPLIDPMVPEVAILVKHRPGCWEAGHVVALAYDPGLL